jgi:hypothetical protein
MEIPAWRCQREPSSRSHRVKLVNSREREIKCVASAQLKGPAKCLDIVNAAEHNTDYSVPEPSALGFPAEAAASYGYAFATKAITPCLRHGEMA